MTQEPDTRQIKLHIVVSMAWWLRPWLWLVVRVAVLSGNTPDWDKVAAMIARSLRVRVSR